eukprot:scaffold16491_cov47-Cyclotella_meneghiniana.AAC.2
MAMMIRLDKTPAGHGDETPLSLGFFQPPLSLASQPTQSKQRTNQHPANTLDELIKRASSN